MRLLSRTRRSSGDVKLYTSHGHIPYGFADVVCKYCGHVQELIREVNRTMSVRDQNNTKKEHDHSLYSTNRVAVALRRFVSNDHQEHKHIQDLSTFILPAPTRPSPPTITWETTT